jgi:hypothetical protein
MRAQRMRGQAFVGFGGLRSRATYRRDRATPVARKRVPRSGRRRQRSRPATWFVQASGSGQLASCLLRKQDRMLRMLLSAARTATSAARTPGCSTRRARSTRGPPISYPARFRASCADDQPLRDASLFRACCLNYGLHPFLTFPSVFSTLAMTRQIRVVRLCPHHSGMACIMVSAIAASDTKATVR